MNPALFAASALALTLGVGGVSVAQAHNPAFWQQELTAEQRTTLERVHTLLQEGKKEEARALAEEAGLPEPRMHVRHLNPEKKIEIDAALESGDYAAFQELTADAPFADQLTEEMFAALAQAHTLREAGDMEGARQVMEEAGFPMHKHRGDHIKFHRFGPGPVPGEGEVIVTE